MKRKDSVWPILLAATLGIAFLCGLGIWQVGRLQQKLALIAALEARMSAQPLSLGDAASAFAMDAAGAEYVRVRTDGNFLPVAPLRKIAVHQGGPGYELLQPFLATDGTFVLVSRGTLPAQSGADALQAPAGLQQLEGIIRRHAAGRGTFDPDNDPKNNLWIWWDLDAMTEAGHPPANAKLAPFILQLLPIPEQPPLPLVLPARADLRNNHLGYAITWFGLAAALAAVAGAFVWQRRQLAEG